MDHSKTVHIFEMNKETMVPIQGKTDTAVRMPLDDGGSSYIDAIKRAPSPKDAINLLKFLEGHKDFAALKTDKDRREYIVKKLRDIRSEELKLTKQKQDLERLQRRKDSICGMLEWADCEPVLQKAERPLFRDLRRSVRGGEAIYFSRNPKDDLPATDFEKEVFCDAEIFVVEHDWASALAADNGQDPIRLPFDVCAFEFRISGYPVIAIATQFGEDVAFSPAVQFKDTWVLTEFTFHAGANGEIDGGLMKVIDFLAKQIRAICIALDAQVAQSEMRREPHEGTAGKNHYSAPQAYHVVSLARRVVRALEAESAGTGRRKRLHFRRGHWRHFSTFKTWVKWCLVGDPETGFIDKHYKL